MLVAHSYYIIFSPVVKRNRQGNLCLCLREFSHIIGKNNSPQRRILGVCTLDTRPIGVFDSGLGGLTALRELSRLLPGEDIIYFGDTGRVPYGGRSRETLIRYARQDVAFLRTFDLKGIVVACGTVSTTALDVLTAENDIPIWGVVGRSASSALRPRSEAAPMSGASPPCGPTPRCSPPPARCSCLWWKTGASGPETWWRRPWRRSTSSR